MRQPSAESVRRWKGCDGPSTVPARSRCVVILTAPIDTVTLVVSSSSSFSITIIVTIIVVMTIAITIRRARRRRCSGLATAASRRASEKLTTYTSPVRERRSCSRDSNRGRFNLDRNCNR